MERMFQGTCGMTDYPLFPTVAHAAHGKLMLLLWSGLFPAVSRNSTCCAEGPFTTQLVCLRGCFLLQLLQARPVRGSSKGEDE